MSNVNGFSMGNVFDSQISTSEAIKAYAIYDHSAWRQVMGPFIKAFKGNAKTIAEILPNTTSPQGSMWYRPLSLNTTCADHLGKPDGSKNGFDAINYAVLLPVSIDATINVYTGKTLLHSTQGVTGLTYGSIKGVKVGIQMVEVVQNEVIIGRAVSNVDVVDSGCSLYNYNYNVVSFGAGDGNAVPSSDESAGDDSGEGGTGADNQDDGGHNDSCTSN